MSVQVNAMTDKHNFIFGEQKPHLGEQEPHPHVPFSRTDADTWYYAAINAQERDVRIEHLRKCLDINPFHSRANALWDSLAAETDTQKNIKFHTRSAILSGAVKAFVGSGWHLKLEMNNIAQLQKPTGMQLKRAILLTSTLGVIGALLVIFRHFTAEHEHVHLHLTESGTLTVIHQRETREIHSLDDLCAIADGVPPRLSLAVALLLSTLSTLAWVAIL